MLMNAYLGVCLGDNNLVLYASICEPNRKELVMPDKVI